MLETVFSSTTSSLWGIRRKGDEFEPIFDPRDETPSRSAFIIAAQAGMMRLVDDMLPLIELVPDFGILPDLAATATLRFLESPTRAEAATLEGVIMTSVGLDTVLNLEMAAEVTLSKILQSPRRQLARMRNCYWRAGFEARTRYPARCSLALIEKLALMFANGRNLLMRGCRRCRFRRQLGGARADANPVGACC